MFHIFYNQSFRCKVSLVDVVKQELRGPFPPGKERAFHPEITAVRGVSGQRSDVCRRHRLSRVRRLHALSSLGLAH